MWVKHQQNGQPLEAYELKREPRYLYSIAGCCIKSYDIKAEVIQLLQRILTLQMNIFSLGLDTLANKLISYYCLTQLFIAGF